MKGFYIEISNDLLDPKHCQQMADSVWLFMWFLDKMTVINHDKGEGKVLGGKPIKFEDVKNDLGISRSTYNRWIAQLKKGGYIKGLRAPQGQVITVLKAKKRFARLVKEVESDVPKMTHHKKSDDSKMAHQMSDSDTSDDSQVTHQMTDSDTSNKTVAVDSSSKTNTRATSARTPKVKKPRSRKDMLVDPTPMNLQDFLKWCRTPPNGKDKPARHIEVIAGWAEAESPPYTTKGQWTGFIRRNGRAAMLLTSFNDQQLQEAYDRLQKDIKRKDKNTGKEIGFITKYTLETVSKYV